MTMIYTLHPEFSAKARQLADDGARSSHIRTSAREVLDLAALLETWPVRRELNLDEDLKRQTLGLCQLSGVALCGKRRCMAAESTDSNVPCSIF